MLTREREYRIGNGEGVLYWQGRGGSVLASKRSTVLAKGKSTVLAGEREYLAGKGVLDLQGIGSSVLARDRGYCSSNGEGAPDRRQGRGSTVPSRRYSIYILSLIHI